LARYKKEAVTVSFHYLIRQSVDDDDGEITQTGFDQTEFDALSEKLCGLPPMDLDDEKVQDRIRLKKAVPIEEVEALDDRTVFGVYRAAYWGHAFENTVVGKVPADSLNLRRFYFILYLAKDGRLYIGVQYLGQYGSYEGIKNTLIRFLNGDDIVAHTFRQDSVMFEDVDPSELHVTVARRPESIADSSSISEEAVVTFKKKGRDKNFGERLRSRLLPVMGTDVAQIRRAASELVNDSGLMDVSDADISDCTVVGRVNGQRKTIYMISQGLRATQFLIATQYNQDGLPLLEPTRDRMCELLESRVISVIYDD
jgi:hypothetical protein